VIYPDPKPGDVLTAEMLRVIYAGLREPIAVVPPLYITGTGAIGWGEEGGFWVEFTGAPSGAKHPWKEVLPEEGGTWADGVREGSTSDDPAYEINGSTVTLTGKRARAWRDRASYEVRFHYSTCT
jgi:hypothetical protein